MPVAFVSKAHAAGLNDTTLDSQNVTVTGNVYDYAVPNTLSTPIDLGNIHAGGTLVADRFSAELGPSERLFGKPGRQFPETGIRSSSPAGPRI